MKIIDRIKMVKAMEFIARHVNNEEIFIDDWLSDGVADGDIEYGDLSISDEDFDKYGTKFYIENDRLRELMKVFLQLMHDAYEDGGLFVNDGDLICTEWNEREV